MVPTGLLETRVYLVHSQLEGVETEAGETDYSLHFADVKALRRCLYDEMGNTRVEMTTGETVAITDDYDYALAEWKAWLRYVNAAPPLFSSQ